MQQASDPNATYFVQSSFQTVPIWSLSDDLLSKIFVYLNANNRFRLAEVCTRWAGVVQMDWTDITRLDLSSIPASNVGPIVGLCPKLESITAQDCELHLSSITANLRGELKSLSLYRVSANAHVPPSLLHLSFPLCEAVFNELRSLPHLEELILCELRIGTVEFNKKAQCLDLCFQLPAPLRRLELSSRFFCSLAEANVFQTTAEPWDDLECLIVDAYEHDGDREENREVHALAERRYDLGIRSVFWLEQLRELCILPFAGIYLLFPTNSAFMRELPRLEVLCIDVGSLLTSDILLDMVPLFTSHPTLRIIIITGSSEYVDDFSSSSSEDSADYDAEEDVTLVPPRRRYPNGFDSDPLPFLHVFIGGTITQKIRFATPLDAMEIHPITLSMAAFLEQPEVAAIFKGSWIGEMIKKSAKFNAPLWDYDDRTAESFLAL